MIHQIEQQMRRNVLVVDDEIINRQMLGYILDTEYHVLYAENGAEALELLRARADQISVVLLDILMPVMSGFEFLEAVKADEALRRVPVIVMTSERDAELKSLKLGAVDFIKKPYDMPEIILARVQRIIELAEDQSIIQAAENDELTGLYNKEFFFKYAERMQQLSPEQPMDALVMDIEHFHLINERRGRGFGDQILKVLAERLHSFSMESGGLSCRYGGDVFYLLCPHRPDYGSLVDAIQRAIQAMPDSIRVRLRVGVYENADKQLEIERQFDSAKVACDSIRNDHTRTVAYYDQELHETEVFHENLINDMQRAMDERQIQVYFQPKYDIRTNCIAGAEALVRWIHPTMGFISPGAFIPLFERNGFLTLLDPYVWEKCCQEIVRCREKGLPLVPISINVSRMLFDVKDLVDQIISLTDRYGIDPSLLHIELTESASAENPLQVAQTLKKLHDNGFIIELDDFGAGYSTLTSLRTLTLDIMKLDMSIIRHASRTKDFSILRYAILLAECMKLKTVAEGVETSQELEALRVLGCDYVQGYYYSKPLPRDEFETYLKEHGSNALLGGTLPLLQQ